MTDMHRAIPGPDHKDLGGLTLTLGDVSVALTDQVWDTLEEIEDDYLASATTDADTRPTPQKTRWWRWSGGSETKQ